MERKLAEQIVALVNSCIDQLIGSLEPVEAGTSEEDFAAYKRGIGRVITTFDAEILDRIAREHPDLLPDDEDGDSTAPEDVPPRSKRN
jgi:hypothetical protein